ncbi:50S ribosomal protein L9 [Candidatus Epulonipiscium fishelsonii]|uniref:50S ribosomal protein L9 n=1 Tax=Candidatus Epulonipiscium fishelsonii TaxID=77094 RepID=A0ACC8XCR6_9FIRM|nr:50S ribosomal protein L9 [Epulopiscium sp. SCG-B11WGA-EpuloA1]ONI43203.1 50S ribosomal protein L9 [Epulopiscium sp. SCG-B05WGA-EpuloA1]ONI47880.1 50S ribosomal protein L9 [Epulopiscium sp. SCG-C06WGA-EpuloA1]
MKVILTEDVKNLGKKGDVLEVKDGYAKNALFPKKLAVEATPAAINKRKLEQKAEDKKKQEDLDNATKIKEVINDKKITIPIKTGEGGKVFGSVTTKEIADSIKDVFNIIVDKKKIQLSNPIKAIGAMNVTIKLHPQIVAQIVVETTGM